MNFRPCIDIHNGKVKQIVGGSLRDAGDRAEENFVSERNAADYAELYKKDGLRGGHIIILNGKDSEFYEATKTQALSALSAYPGGMQVGGGITDENAKEFLEAGASQVIVTSFVFKNGHINRENLNKISAATGREGLVLDLSCRRRGEDYFIVTDRWQNYTKERLGPELLNELAGFASEFLIHAVDVEGKQSGIEPEVVKLLAEYSPLPCTYAGGIGSYEDIEIIEKAGKSKVDFTIGSALDIFGGRLEYDRVKLYK